VRLWGPPRSRTIAFTSGKGGVGTSSLVLNLALVLARLGKRVALLDGDFGSGSLNVLLGLCPRLDVRHVVGGERRLAEVLMPGPHGIGIIAAGSGVAELANLDAAARQRILAQLPEVGRLVDYLLIDTGPGMGETVMSLVLAAGEAVLVTRPEPTALADAYTLMKTTIARATTYPFNLLVNMVRDADEARWARDALHERLVRLLAYRPGHTGHVPMDPHVVRAVIAQIPFVVSAPGSPAARAVNAVAAEMLATGVECASCEPSSGSSGGGRPRVWPREGLPGHRTTRLTGSARARAGACYSGRRR
jgi:flagellar biosynthesis protein FlhG